LNSELAKRMLSPRVKERMGGHILSDKRENENVISDCNDLRTTATKFYSIKKEEKKPNIKSALSSIPGKPNFVNVKLPSLKQGATQKISPSQTPTLS